jgi:hypothetical protein
MDAAHWDALRQDWEALRTQAAGISCGMRVTRRKGAWRGGQRQAQRALR